MSSSVRVFAPASASNLGPVFDVLGLSLGSPGDVVAAELIDGDGVESECFVGPVNAAGACRVDQLL